MESCQYGSIPLVLPLPAQGWFEQQLSCPLASRSRCGALGEGDPEQSVCGELQGGGAEADTAGAQDGVEQNHPPLVCAWYPQTPGVSWGGLTP